MQKDFTYDAYTKLIDSLKKYGSAFLPFIEYVSNHNHYEKCTVLRHDVDKLPKNALRMADLENRLGVKASYYFRTVKEGYDENIIRQIADMGHEIGYHYENLSICRGNYEDSILN